MSFFFSFAVFFAYTTACLERCPISLGSSTPSLSTAMPPRRSRTREAAAVTAASAPADDAEEQARPAARQRTDEDVGRCRR